ncbi:MAG: thiamine-phosphate kinase [Hyphomicrobiaceae bacterium]|nr:thiamine-phosphate kinase [Hyphomicrobiaceae bacterium]
MTEASVGDRAVSESDIIDRYLKPLSAGFPGAFGLMDDCAALAVPEGDELVMSMDAVAAGVHFFPDDDAADIAWKALAVNVSDLAAKGAIPVAYLMSLAFPEAPRHSWLEGFARGLAEAQQEFGIVLAGGDTDRRPGPISITITAMGTTSAGRNLLRSEAHAGDVLFVSGTLGDSALGLRLRQDPQLAAAWGLSPERAAGLVTAYLRPQPRLGLGPALRRYAAASMDISDGLGKDLERLCRASAVGTAIAIGDLPLSPAAAAAVRADPANWSIVIGGGDDYEVLTAVPSTLAADFRSSAAAGGIKVTEIGVLDDGEGVLFAAVDGTPLKIKAGGWDHFAS